MHPDKVIPACEESLRKLGLDYLDMYVVHWPWPNFHEPGATGDAKNSHAVPYIHEQFMAVWEKMVDLKQMGKIKNLGTSNQTQKTMELLLRDTDDFSRPIYNQTGSRGTYKGGLYNQGGGERQVMSIAFSRFFNDGDTSLSIGYTNQDIDELSGSSCRFCHNLIKLLPATMCIISQKANLTRIVLHVPCLLSRQPIIQRLSRKSIMPTAESVP